ncbi:fibrobacter succinogenes major paralogous domain-containing protein [Candidatus Neomarinimicrobiota bacterium]
MKRLFVLFLYLFLVSCSGTQRAIISIPQTATVTDIDGNVYKTVRIGDQWWMAENLRVTHYRSGDEIPNRTDDAEWDQGSGGSCCYNNDHENAEVYGRLYNWFAVTDSRGIAPDGWHVPTDDEWQELVEYLGGESKAGGALKGTGTIESGDGLWRDANEGASNSSGFTALPGGYRYNHGVFDGMGSYAYFWTASETSGGTAWHRYIYSRNTEVRRYDHGWKQGGYSVRCVKD